MFFNNLKGDGFYALCDGRQLRDIDDKCELAQTISIDAISPFEFWYHMNGFQIGTLELIANDEVIWSLTDRQADQWLLATVNLPVGDYEVIEFFKLFSKYILKDYLKIFIYS